MKNWVMIIGIFLSVSFISQSTHADYCPVAEGLNPQTPPAGWSLFISPLYEGVNSQPNNFYFVSATHSLNQNNYFQQVFCEYETCPTQGCPNFTLISQLLYQLPASNISPWDVYPMLVNTVVCQPPNHDPYQCLFTNVRTQ